MIELSRALVRQFRAVLRRSLMDQEPRGAWPLLLCRTGDDGLTLQAQQQDVAVRYHQSGKRSPEGIAFRANVLAEFEGRTEAAVTLEQVAVGKGRASWNDGSVPRIIDFDTVKPDSWAAFPPLPSKLSPMPKEFLLALFEAARTTPRDLTRVAMSRVQLRGKSGEVVATDGRQLLVQGGFSFPWREDVLVPRISAFGCRELEDVGAVRMGRTQSHVAVLVGPWTFLLTLDTSSRFPAAESVIPAANSVRTHLQLDPEDAAFLSAALPKLPGSEDDHAPITLDLNPPIAVRTRAEGSGTITEVVLSRSTTSGNPFRLCTDRQLLRRALGLGFTELHLVKPEVPLICRDPSRTFVWMPLDPKGAIPPSTGAFRITSAEHTNVTRPKSPTQPFNNPRRRTSMPVPPNNGPTPRNGMPSDVPSSDSSHPGSLVALIEEAEKVREMLHEAQGRLGRLIVALKQQRKQSRAVQQALGSLRQLKQLGP